MFKLIYLKIRGISLIKKYLFLKQFIKFGIAGVIFTLLDFSIYIILTRFINWFSVHYLWANLAAMSIAAIGNFLMNRKWTFRNHDQRVYRQYFKFWAVALSGMLIYQQLFSLLVNNLAVYDIFAKALSALMVFAFRFTVHKFWTFKHGCEKQEI